MTATPDQSAPFVRHYNVCRDLVFANLDEVHNAILVLGGAAAPLFSSQFNHLNPEARVRADMMALDVLGSPASFAHTVADECIDVLTNGRRPSRDPERPLSYVYQKTWDWEGPGPFQKTTLTVTPRPNIVGLFPDSNPETVYEMELWSARIGGQHSLTLGKTLKREPGFHNATCAITFPCDNKGRVTIHDTDLNKILVGVGLTPSLAWDNTFLTHGLSQTSTGHTHMGCVDLFTEPEYGIRCVLSIASTPLAKFYHKNLDARDIGTYYVLHDDARFKSLSFATATRYTQKEVEKRVPVERRVSSHSYTRVNPNWGLHRKHPKIVEQQVYEVKTETEWVEDGFENARLELTLHASDLNKYRTETRDRINQLITTLVGHLGLPIVCG